MGENKDQEAGAKLAELTAEVREQMTFHFVGQLQSNKAHSVAQYADVVQSVDRLKLVRALDRGAGEAGRALDVAVQVALDDPLVDSALARRIALGVALKDLGLA